MNEKINDQLTLTNCSRTYVNDKGEEKPCGDFGWWLYDEVFGMNLAMRAKSKEKALIEALAWYQERFLKERSEHRKLRKKVNTFLDQFSEEDDE